jgi:hypothetical protein
MVTFRLSMCVKSDEPSRPGSCLWLKKTSLAGPCSAFHCRTRRSTVRRCRCQSWPGHCCCSHSTSVLACKPGSRCSSSSSRAQTFTSGSGRRRPLGAVLVSLGNWPRSRYLRAVLRSMPAFIAAKRSEPPWFKFNRTSLTCASVTWRPVPIGNSFFPGSCHCSRVHRQG